MNIRTQTEEAIIELIPSLFEKQKEECKIIFIDLNNGFLTTVGEQTFESFKDLEKHSWDINYSQRYIALIKNSKSNIITFRGREKVASYKRINGDIKLDFFKDKTSKTTTTTMSNIEKTGFINELKNLFSK